MAGSSTLRLAWMLGLLRLGFCMAIRRRQFTIRTLLIVVTLISLAMSLWLWHRRLESEVAERYNTFQRALTSKDYTRAYTCMSRQYRADHSIHDFISHWDGRIPVLEQGAIVRATPWSAKSYPYHLSFFDFENGETYFLVKEHGQWCFTGDVEMSFD